MGAQPQNNEGMQAEDLPISLAEVFDQINIKHFDGFLDPPVIRWNSRLRASAGRFIPGSRKFWRELPPVIEVAPYLLEEPNREALIADTMAHEMIHYWLWVRRLPFGHSPEFWRKMKLMGVSRWNPVPRTRPYRYIYACPACRTEFKARKKLGTLACSRCCKQHSNGSYDPRFKLYLSRRLIDEVPEHLSADASPGKALQSFSKSS
jgi:predicted SprT family Zn-dependent metalloprotease